MDHCLFLEENKKKCATFKWKANKLQKTTE